MKHKLSVTDVRALTGSAPADARAILERLVVQLLLKPVDSEAGLFELQDYLKGEIPDLSTGQVSGWAVAFILDK